VTTRTRQIKTVKQLGDQIRRDLAAAQEAGTLPRDVGEFGQVEYSVRASQPKAGPKVTVTVTGVEPLLPNYPHPSDDDVKTWLATDGAALLAKVERIRRYYNPDPPTYSGETKFGRIFLSAEVMRERWIEPGPEPVIGQR
jgi:hypothetical protein